MNSRPIRFLHRGAIAEVSVPATRSVLDWLREDQHCTGTKEGCAEGDCGACTVVLGELDAQGALQLKPVNACIQFVPTLDGKALFTVEDLAALSSLSAPSAPPSPSSPSPPFSSSTLHPVQQSMVDCHGSQCGFCTPGFVMSLWACYERHQAAGTRPTRQQLADDLSGNLCRCTGYRPILDAGEQMFDSPAAALDRTPVLQALQQLAADPPLHTAEGFHAPQTLQSFADVRLARPQAQVLAGSTDIGLWVTKQFRALPELLYTGRVAELQQLQVQVHGNGRALHIGAAVPLEAAWRALAREVPSLQDVWLRFASLPIRMTGTMGGNVANGSPIGDAPPVLMALGASIVLRRGDVERVMHLQDFYLGYMHNALQPGEFVQALQVPLNPQAQVRAYKISKRFDCDISALCAGLAIELDGDQMSGNISRNITAARVAFGGMAATVKRAAHTEAALLGQPWTEATLQAAQAALARDFQPMSDMRASAAYRLQVAQNLLRRFWLETRPDSPMPAHTLSVWAGMQHAGGSA